jgi:hypothetical protein
MRLTILITALKLIINTYSNRYLQRPYVAVDCLPKRVLRGDFLLVDMFYERRFLIGEHVLASVKRLVLIGSSFTWPEGIKVVILKL